MVKQMKATGIVRRLDHLGRLCIPMEIRKTLDLSERDSIEIYVDKEHIILKKHEPSCTICNSMENIIDFAGKNICKKCITKAFGVINHG